MTPSLDDPMETLRYPVGRFARPEAATAAERSGWIDEIEALPARLREAVAELDEAGLDTPYRPGGWTVRQVVHHVADSHLNALVRFKLALTEDEPTIMPYDEARWAELADARLPLAPTLALLDGLHARWAALLHAMSDADFARAYFHPEQGRAVPLFEALASYAWHSRHHTAHVRSIGA